MVDKITTPKGEPLKILVIEDDTCVLKLIDRWLSCAGCIVRRAACAEDGIMIARSEPMDVILTDLCLPGMNGFEAIQALRGEAATPVLVMTGHADSEFHKDAACFGAVDLIAKPVSIEDLIARIRVAVDSSAGD